MSNFGAAFLLFYAISIYGTFFKDISWGINLYIMQYWLNPVDRWWYGGLPSVRWSFTVAICILAAFFIKKSKYKKTGLFDAPQIKWLLINAVWFAMISQWAVWPYMQSKFLQDHIKLIIFILLAYKTIDTPKKFEGVMWTMMLGAYYVSYESKRVGRNSDGRVEGTGPADAGGDGNNAAASLVSVIPVLLYFVVRSFVVKTKLWKRLFLLFLMAFILNGVVLINSRGSFLGLVASCAYFGFYVFTNRKVTMKQRFQLIGVVILGLCAFLYLADDSFWERMESISEESESDTGGGGRKLFWSLSLEMVKEYPWGAGGWGFQRLSPHYVPPEYMPRNASVRAVHSLYFQCIIERGYMGTVFFAALLLSNFLFIKKTQKYLLNKGDMPSYFLGLAIESGYIAFLAAATFINRLNCEILYWQPLFIACFGNIYMLQEQKAKRAEKAAAKSGK